MSKKDSVKSSINIFTAIMVVLLTALFAVIGYAFVNYETLNSAKWYAIVVALVVLAVLFYLYVLYIKKDLKRLEKMK